MTGGCCICLRPSGRQFPRTSGEPGSFPELGWRESHRSATRAGAGRPDFLGGPLLVCLLGVGGHGGPPALPLADYQALSGGDGHLSCVDVIRGFLHTVSQGQTQLSVMSGPSFLPHIPLEFPIAGRFCPWSWSSVLLVPRDLWMPLLQASTQPEFPSPGPGRLPGKVRPSGLE